VRIGLIGDTQGRFDVAALLARVADEFVGVDEVWHAGDWQYAEVLEGLRRIAPLSVVNGNAPDDPNYPMKLLRTIEGHRLGMVHVLPRRGDPWLAKLDICIHGHSHKWRDEVVDGVRLINVSTPTAAGFSRERTAGILTLAPGQVDLTRIEF